MSPDNSQAPVQRLLFYPRQQSDSCRAARWNKVLIVRKWLHADPNNWFCYYKTRHFNVGQTHIIPNFRLQLSLLAFHLICPDEGHLISFIPASLTFLTHTLRWNEAASRHTLESSRALALMWRFCINTSVSTVCLQSCFSSTPSSNSG